MKPIVYNSKDIGAPQITPTAGSINTVIKTCLTLGYGSKQPAAWVIEFEDTNNHKLAIRSSSPQSIQSVLLFDDSRSKETYVSAFTDWDASTNTGVNNFSDGALYKTWIGSYNADWIVIATDKFFYVWIQQADGATYGSISAFGDAKQIRQDSQYCISMFLGRGAATTSSSYTGYTYIDASTGKKARLPNRPFPSSAGFGDSSDGGAFYGVSSFDTDLVVLSQFAVYTPIDSSWQPAFTIPGSLLAHATLKYETPTNNVRLLSNQTPYLEPIVLLRQLSHGYWYIHTDDWG